MIFLLGRGYPGIPVPGGGLCQWLQYSYAEVLWLSWLLTVGSDILVVEWCKLNLFGQ